MSVLAKVWNCYREVGAWGLVRRIRSAMWTREPYLVIRKELQPSKWPASYDDIVFRVADLDDLPALCRVWPESFRYVGPDVSAVLRRRMVSGAICIVGHVPDGPADPVCFSWLSRHDYMMLTLLGTSAPPWHVCAKNLWVSPEFRRRQIALRTQRFVETVACERGFRCMWGFIVSGNAASCSLHDRLGGYERLGTVFFDRRFGRRLATWEYQGRRQRLEVCPPEKRIP